jgi:hypothetical protein
MVRDMDGDTYSGDRGPQIYPHKDRDGGRPRDMERKGRQAKTHHGKTQEADTRETVAGESPCGQHGPASALPLFSTPQNSIILFP